jgi:hypothetical protein
MADNAQNMGKEQAQRHLGKQLDYHRDAGFWAVGKRDERLWAGAYMVLTPNRRKTPTDTNKCRWHNRAST